MVLPLFAGLVLAGCAKKEFVRVTSNDDRRAPKPASSAAQKDASTVAQPQLAASTTPAPAANIDSNTDNRQTASESPRMAANPVASIPSTATESSSPTPAETTTKPAISAEPAVAITSRAAATPTTPTPAPADYVVSETKPAIAALSPSPATTTGPTTAEPSLPVATIPTPATAPAVDRLAEWKLTADEIKSEFAASGRVSRTKAIGAGEPIGPMDATLVALIHGKLKSDAYTAGSQIEVTADHGVVTLNGSAKSLEQIGRAVAIALDTGGASKAVSLMTLEPAL